MKAAWARLLSDEGSIRRTFRLLLWFKAVFAALEILGGAAVALVTRNTLLGLATWVTRKEFAEDPHDLVATVLLHSVERLSISAKVFAGVYLLAHGVLKLWLVIGLLRERLWIYPVSMAVFALFIVYQLYRFGITQSVWMLALSALDLLVIWLTWREFRLLDRHRRTLPG